MGRPLKIFVLPDVQARDGDDFGFLRSIGKLIVDEKPDVVVQIGDFADCPALSSFDKGKKAFEGRRYRLDIAAAHRAMEALLGPLREYNLMRLRNKKGIYRPRLVLTMGNHEERICRAVNSDPMLDGTIGLSDLKYEYYGWEVHPFLKVVVINGVAFAHYFITGQKGLACSTAQAQLGKKFMSCVAGHQQGLSTYSAYRADGVRLTNIIAGSCYEHFEDYLGPQGNISHWRGALMLKDVKDGEFNPEYIPLADIKSKYAA